MAKPFKTKTGGAATPPAHVASVYQNPGTSVGNSFSEKCKLAVHAIGPHGGFTVTGQTARALVALVSAGDKGITAAEVSSWALRLAAYCHDLRRKHGLSIDTIREKHAGGWHGRHVLGSPVEIVEACHV